MHERVDRELGTAAQLLYHRGNADAASLLLAVEDVRYEWVHDRWNDNYYGASLVVDISLFDRFDDNTRQVIKDALHQVSRANGEGIEDLDVLPRLIAEEGWRTDLMAALAGKPSIQATLARLPERHPVVDHMRFRSTAEVCVYEALKRLQGQLPEDETIAIVPNASVRVRGHTWEPDFLVTYKRRCGMIEVDGGSHRKKYADDKSRDALFEDAGVVRVDRIDVATTSDPVEVDAFVNRFLRRLVENWDPCA